MLFYTSLLFPGGFEDGCRTKRLNFYYLTQKSFRVVGAIC